MKKFVCLLVLFLFSFVSVTFAAVTGDAGGSVDYGSIFATFASLVAAIPFVTEALKGLLRITSPVVSQIVSWLVGVLLAMFAWWLGLGFLDGAVWWVALIYGLAASLAANGVFDTGLIEWLVGLIIKRKK